MENDQIFAWSPTTSRHSQLRLDLPGWQTFLVKLLPALSLMVAVIWVGALVADPGPLSPTSTLLVGIGLISMATVATVGIVLSGGRWARRLAFLSLGSALVVAALRPIDVWWVVGLTSTSVAFGSLFLPGVTDHVRKLPSAAGPPPRAVLVPLALISVPFLMGVTAGQGTSWAVIVVSLSALLAAFAFSRALTGSVVTVRLLWPLLALSVAPFIGLPGSLVSVVVGLTIAAISWHPTVRLAVHPPIETGTTYSIPPELAPTEVLGAAQVDDRGQPT